MRKILFSLLQAGVCGMMIGVVLLVGGRWSQPTPAIAAGAIPEVIQAKRFELIDGKGVVRANIGFSEDGHPGLAICGPNGDSRALLYVSTDGIPFMSMKGPNGKIMTEIGMDKKDDSISILQMSLDRAKAGSMESVSGLDFQNALWQSGYKKGFNVGFNQAIRDAKIAGIKVSDNPKDFFPLSNEKGGYNAGVTAGKSSASAVIANRVAVDPQWKPYIGLYDERGKSFLNAPLWSAP